MLLKQGADASFIIKQDDLNTRLCILSDKPLDTISEEDIMRALLKDEYIYIFIQYKKHKNWTENKSG